MGLSKLSAQKVYLNTLAVLLFSFGRQLWDPGSSLVKIDFRRRTFRRAQERRLVVSKHTLLDPTMNTGRTKKTLFDTCVKYLRRAKNEGLNIIQNYYWVHFFGFIVFGLLGALVFWFVDFFPIPDFPFINTDIQVSTEIF